MHFGRFDLADRSRGTSLGSTEQAVWSSEAEGGVVLREPVVVLSMLLPFSTWFSSLFLASAEPRQMAAVGDSVKQVGAAEVNDGCCNGSAIAGEATTEAKDLCSPTDLAFLLDEWLDLSFDVDVPTFFSAAEVRPTENG